MNIGVQVSSSVMIFYKENQRVYTEKILELKRQFNKVAKINIQNSIAVLYLNISEKAMAPHSSIFAWKIPWTEEPGRLQSMGILQARILEWVAFSFSRGSSPPRD